jgi:hypothetical protein
MSCHMLYKYDKSNFHLGVNMQLVLFKMIAVAIWCGPLTADKAQNAVVQECRRDVQVCLQERVTTFQVESCFMGKNGGR